MTFEILLSKSLCYNLSVMPKSWQVAPHFSDNLIEQLLHNRGIKPEELENFFHPKIEDFTKELSIPGIAGAKKRILKAVENQELIFVFGDYDVDGVCGASIFYHGLTAIGAKVLPYIPHREKEGYGLSKEGLDFAKQKGAGLAITVDNGIVACDAADYAKSLGLDLIITDHHLPGDKKPECLALVHSTKMCGAAVGWCLVKELVDKAQADDLLDLVAIATIGDMVPLLGVNRALVKSGLLKLNETKKVGLKALIAQSGLTLGNVDAYAVGHTLVPRLNAIGRLEHAMDSVRLLCTKETVKAYALAQKLCEANDKKKVLAADALTEAREMVALAGDLKEKRVLVVHSENWIPGVIGLVAARLSEEYHMPAVVISMGEKHGKGSARSIEGVDIVEVMRQCSDHLLDIGGHPKAAGFTIEADKITDFKSRLEEIMGGESVVAEEKLPVDAVLLPRRLNKKTVEELSLFEPMGMGNPRPVFVSMNVKASDLRTVGNGDHLKLRVEGIDAIAFSFGSWINLLKEGQLINVAYYLEINIFNGNSALQLKVLDLQLV